MGDNMSDEKDRYTLLREYLDGGGANPRRDPPGQDPVLRQRAEDDQRKQDETVFSQIARTGTARPYRPLNAADVGPFGADRPPLPPDRVAANTRRAEDAKRISDESGFRPWNKNNRRTPNKTNAEAQAILERWAAERNKAGKK